MSWTNPAAATRSYLTDVNYQNAVHDPGYWMDRLQKMMHTRGASDDGPNMLDNKVADENLCLNTMNSQKVSLIRHEVRLPYENNVILIVD